MDKSSKENITSQEHKQIFDLKNYNTKNYNKNILEKSFSILKTKLDDNQQIVLHRLFTEKWFSDNKKIEVINKLTYLYKKNHITNNENLEFWINNINKNINVSDVMTDSYDNIDLKEIAKLVCDNIDSWIDITQWVNLKDTFIINNELKNKLDKQDSLLSFDDLIAIGWERIINISIQRTWEKLKSLVDKFLESEKSPDELVEQLYLPENEDILRTFLQLWYLKLKSEWKNENIKTKSQNDIKKHFKATLSIAWYNVSNVDLKALKEEEERQRLIEERTQKYIEAAQKRIEARNNQQLQTKKWDRLSETEQKEMKTSNLNKASWAEIVASSNLNLDWIQIPEKHEVDKNMMKIPAFDVAWNDYIKNIWWSTVNIWWKATPIKSIISQRNFREIYNIETNTINENNLITYLSRIYKKPDWTLRLSQEEIAAIKNKVQIFSSYFDKSIKNLSNNFLNVKDVAQKQIKISAVWSVIDNIRWMMKNLEKSEWDNNSKWFEFTSTPPIEQRWDSLIIPCKMNWTKTKIRYDMKSWKLYINSFITKNINWPDKKDKNFKIWQDNYKEIWELKSINNIVSEYYEPEIDIPDRPQIKPQNTAINNKPPINKPIWPQKINSRKQRQMEARKNNKEAFKDMLGQEIDLLWKNIEKELSFQEKKNSIIIKLMKSFNIIKDWWEDSVASITIGWWSKLFELLEAIENIHNEGQTANFQTLESFESLLTEIINFSWLQRWENRKYPEIKKLYEKEYHEWIKKKIQDIKPTQQDDPSTTEKTFDSNFNPELIKLIVDSTISWTSPNQKIDFTKINETMKEMKKDDKNNENSDLELEKELDNI